MEKFLHVKNFDAYQHYKERNISSWIKLYYKTLDDYTISKLTNAERWVFIGLLLIAGKNDNEIPADYPFLSEKICFIDDRKNFVSIVEKLIVLELVSLKDKQSGRGKPSDPKAPAEDKPDIHLTILNAWNSHGIIAHKAVDDKIVKKVDARIKEGYSVEKIIECISNYAAIINGNDYWFTYRWTLWDFLQRGFEKFKDFEIAKANYLKKGTPGKVGGDKGKYDGIGH